VYPYLKKAYRRLNTVKADATHFVRIPYKLLIQAYFDIEIDGKDAGRLNFELFGKEAPKTVNNFLGFCSGDFSKFATFTESRLHEVIPGRFIRGGDFMSGDGTGSATVYESSTMEAEKNKLKFVEPYLLAAAANDEGKVGS
jgi:cyclophilin family peptidyl-prolyl cis-trans isomerase